MALCRRALPLADSVERLCQSRQSEERLSLRREAAEVERPDSSELGGDEREAARSFATRALNRQSEERRSLRREAAAVERPDSSELGGDDREREAAKCRGS